MRLTVFGPTASGKSTLINALLNVYALPSGGSFTTARICVFRHATQDAARVSLCRIGDTGLEEIRELLSLADQQEPHDLGSLLEEFLDRSRAPPAGQVFDDWVKEVVVVHYPLALLAGGVELCDVPGVSASDPHDDVLKAHRANFLRIYR
eukprot:TRINITY_DN7844_c0_g1_i2.p1 TRINITY_DN7844_c0_g1~~TRINITY_DN7844_c0_g1_i2.p1  ORF type:complete len:150 (-),score=54.89 TRINITY_DN7844_c0_g1_i2:164-613(-)